MNTFVTISKALLPKNASVSTGVISRRELFAYQSDLKGSIFRQIREMFSYLKQNGFTQKALADRIEMDEGQLSRRLKGTYDLRLETLSDLARGMDCRIDVQIMPLSYILNTPVAEYSFNGVNVQMYGFAGAFVLDRFLYLLRVTHPLLKHHVQQVTGDGYTYQWWS
jgi:transcriptional regulator with XRE-family HTH domain